jgi:hypothetical protein
MTLKYIFLTFSLKSILLNATTRPLKLLAWGKREYFGSDPKLDPNLLLVESGSGLKKIVSEPQH